MRFNDLTGKRFGRLTVLNRDSDHVSKNGKHRVKWLCVCDCGNITSVISDSLTTNRIRSCGCYKKEYMSQKQGTHRETYSKLYGVWCSMKGRCYNQRVFAYDQYGGRGITVCEDWKESYESFREWSVRNGYVEGLTLDRINNDLGYSPENCRWVDRVIQANNRRSNCIYTYNGESHNIKEWSEIYDIPYKRLHYRLSHGWNIERALNT